jgi:hypothetical protein
MGRRKKDDIVSYVHIVSSSYVQKAEYEKAQIAFSSALDDKGNIKHTVSSSLFGLEGENYDETDEVFD